MTNENILKSFLKYHRKLTSFKRQQNRDRISALGTGVRLSIDKNFVWCNTDEGHEFWSDLNRQWGNLCIDFKVTGNIDLIRL